MRRPTDKELDCTVARMLLVGVSISAVMVFVGGLMLLRHPMLPVPDYSHFHAVDPSLRSLSGITMMAIHLHGRGLVQFGLMLLIATPIARVVFCAIGFIRQRDALYTGISAIVLTILLYGLTKGAH